MYIIYTNIELYKCGCPVVDKWMSDITDPTPSSATFYYLRYTRELVQTVIQHTKQSISNSITT